MKYVVLIFLLLSMISVQSQDAPELILKPQEESVHKIKKMNTNQLDNQYKKQIPFIVIDARPEGFTDGWRIPKSMRLPYKCEDAMISKKLPLKSMKLIVYSTNKQCVASTIMAKRLMDMGYQEVFVYQDGIQGWRKAGKETVREFEPRKN